jgi:hypothetical protein
METGRAFSGTSSTLKKLVPSFKSNPAKVGFLAECNRFAYLDEFFRCLLRSQNRHDEKEESFSLLNDLMEHQEREAGSGVSSVIVNMTSRVFATSNPIREADTMEGLLTKFEPSFLSRMLIYFQSDEHVNLVKDVAEDNGAMCNMEYKIEPEALVSIIDYLHSFQVSGIDESKLIEIFNENLEFMSSDLLLHYTSRHKHHLKCIFDGVVKLRCILTGDESFQPQPVDYDTTRDIWVNVIKSWLPRESIRCVPLKNRHLFLPEKTQFVFGVIRDKGPITRLDLLELIKDEITKLEFNTALIILDDNNLIRWDNEIVSVVEFKEQAKEEK